MSCHRYENAAGRPFGGPAAPEHPFKVYVHLIGEAPATNNISYETAEDARIGGKELLSRWLSPIGFEVRNELTGEVIPDELDREAAALAQVGLF